MAIPCPSSFPWSYVLAECARAVKGGVVATPAGVGFSPYPVQDTFGGLRTGDVVRISIDGIGTLENPVALASTL